MEPLPSKSPSSPQSGGHPRSRAGLRGAGGVTFAPASVSACPYLGRGSRCRGGSEWLPGCVPSERPECPLSCHQRGGVFLAAVRAEGMPPTPSLCPPSLVEGVKGQRGDTTHQGHRCARLGGHNSHGGPPA